MGDKDKDGKNPAKEGAEPEPAFVKGMPKGTPQDLKDFLSCKADTYTFAKGKVGWLKPADLMPPDAPGKDLIPDSAAASLEFSAGENGAINVSVSADAGFGALPVGGLTVSVKDGGLTVDDRSGAANLDAAKKPVDDFVKDFNDQLKKSGKKLDKADIKGGNLVVTKAKLVSMLPGGTGTGDGEYASVTPGAGTSSGSNNGLRVAGAAIILTGCAFGIGLRDRGNSTELVQQVSQNPTEAVTPQKSEPPAPPKKRIEGNTGIHGAIGVVGLGQMPPLEIVDGKVGVDHVGPGNSFLITCISVSPGHDGPWTIDWTVGPGAPIKGTGNVVDGIGQLRGPIHSYGSYGNPTLTDALGDTAPLGPLSSQVPFNVTSTPMPCNPADLKRAPALKAPAEDTPTEKPNDTNPPAPSTNEANVAPATTTTVSVTTTTPPWSLLLVPGSLGVGGALFLAAGRRDKERDGDTNAR